MASHATVRWCGQPHRDRRSDLSSTINLNHSKVASDFRRARKQPPRPIKQPFILDIWEISSVLSTVWWMAADGNRVEKITSNQSPSTHTQIYVCVRWLDDWTSGSSDRHLIRSLLGLINGRSISWACVFAAKFSTFEHAFFLSLSEQLLSFRADSPKRFYGNVPRTDLAGLLKRAKKRLNVEKSDTFFYDNFRQK